MHVLSSRAQHLPKTRHSQWLAPSREVVHSFQHELTAQLAITAVEPTIPCLPWIPLEIPIGNDSNRLKYIPPVDHCLHPLEYEMN